MHAKSNLNIDLYKSRKNIFDTPLCTLPPHAHGHTKTGKHHKKVSKGHRSHKQNNPLKMFEAI